MIYSAVNHIAGELNQFLKRSYERSEDMVVVSSLLDKDGSVPSNLDNRVVVCLANVETESAMYGQPSMQSGGGPRAVVTAEPLRLNLYLMMAACFSSANYPEGLKCLSSTLRYFQMNPLFDHQNSPELDTRIDRLALDIVDLDIHQLSNMWGILGTRYQPSVMYKVRMVTIDGGAVRAELPTVSEARPSLGVASGSR